MRVQHPDRCRTGAKLGYQVKVVERWNPYAKIRQDLFGVDILALKPGEPVLVVQATTGNNHAARCTKLDAEGFTALWEGAGAMIEVWSWSKQGPRGQRKVCTVRREALSVLDPLVTVKAS